MEPITLGIALISKFVPDIIGLFAGKKKAEFAKDIIGIAEKVTGIKGAGALEVIEKDSAIALEFKKVVMDSKARLEQMYLDDVADARNMQSAALSQDDLFSKRFVYYFAIGVTFATFSYLFAVTFIDMPEENRRIADTVSGFLMGTCLSSIFSFLYGTTRGSSGKQEQIKGLTHTLSKLLSK